MADPNITVAAFFRHPRPFDDPFVKSIEKQYHNFPKCKSARDDKWIRLPRDQQGRDLKPMYYSPIKESPWEPPRPVVTHGHPYALTDEVRHIFPHSGLHLIPRATLKDLLVPDFTGYENSREAEKWITTYSEWAIMYGLSAPLTKELLVDYIRKALRFIPQHPTPKKDYATWEDFLRDFFLDMKIKKLEQFKAWYWEKRKAVPIIWFSHTELKLATNYFDSRLMVGDSSVSRLFKAAMPNMTDAVVKRYKKVTPTSLGKVLREITVHRYLPRHHTPTIVHLVGYCTSVQDPLLLYEFAPNGTLREHMKGKYGDYLWRSAPIRLAIALDIATGIGELHYNGKLQVYHRDIKPSNILLDRSYRARIADFGDSLVIKSDDDRYCPPVCGSLGYLDPVYRQTGRCDDKTDVYSLGVVLMELATGYKAWDPFRQVEHKLNPFLVGLVLDVVEKGEIESVIRPGDPYYVGSPALMEGNAIVTELVRVALWCCCPNLGLRPRADTVAATLLQLQQRWVDPAFRALQHVNECELNSKRSVEEPVGTSDIPELLHPVATKRKEKTSTARGKGDPKKSQEAAAAPPAAVAEKPPKSKQKFESEGSLKDYFF